MTKLDKASIYIHWPYCEAKCPYCDFNSYGLGKKSHERAGFNELESEFIAAFARELEFYRQSYGPRLISSLYFGGGTPSLLSLQALEKILDICVKNYIFEPQAEITIEANPSSAEVEKFKYYKAIGINRLSLGVQSFDDKALKFLGRVHSSHEARAALEHACAVFDNYTFDLIYARAGQTLKDWEAELKEGLRYNAPHMSLYELTIEPDTLFERQVRAGKMQVVDDEQAAQFYSLTQDIMNEHNMPAYEVSNHAKPQFYSRHNMNYWAYNQYLGFGPGAHSRIFIKNDKVIAQYNQKNPKIWQKKIIEFGQAIEQSLELDTKTQARELLLCGMRTRRGVLKNRLQNLSGRKINATILNNLIDLGLVEKSAIEESEKFIKPTQHGLLFVDYIVNKLQDD